MQFYKKICVNDICHVPKVAELLKLFRNVFLSFICRHKLLVAMKKHLLETNHKHTLRNNFPAVGSSPIF